jgi:hypothetical protein
MVKDRGHAGWVAGEECATGTVQRVGTSASSSFFSFLLRKHCALESQLCHSLAVDLAQRNLTVRYRNFKITTYLFSNSNSNQPNGVGENVFLN